MDAIGIGLAVALLVNAVVSQVRHFWNGTKRNGVTRVELVLLGAFALYAAVWALIGR